MSDGSRERMEWTDARIDQFYKENEADHNRFDARMEAFGDRVFQVLIAACVGLVGLFGTVLAVLFSSGGSP